MNRIATFEKVSFEQYLKDFYNLHSKHYATEEKIRDIYDDIKLPTRSTSGSAGHDFHTPEAFCLWPNETINIPTGIRAKIDDGWVLLMVPRSGMGFKYGVRLMNTVGVVDSDYYYSDNEGHIHIKLHNATPDSKVWAVDAGSGIAQGIFVPFGITYEDKVDTIRNGGFGSTGV